MGLIERAHQKNLAYAVDILANIAAIKPIGYKGCAGMRIYIPAAFSTLTTLTVYDSPDDPNEKDYVGTFYAAQDTTAGGPVSFPATAGNSYDLPAAMFAAGAIKLIGNAAGTIAHSEKG
jgi:hypothetical protein